MTVRAKCLPCSVHDRYALEHGHCEAHQQYQRQHDSYRPHMQLFTSPLCKFFESPVQVPMGFLTRPVTGNYAHDDTRQCEDKDDHECSFHMTSVPLVWPRYSAIAIAVMNMPAMIHTMSIISTPILLVVLPRRSM